MMPFPCPRCGEEENVWAHYHPGRQAWQVMCDECDWEGPWCPGEDEAISAAAVAAQEPEKGSRSG